jgi:hypothetical protein
VQEGRETYVTVKLMSDLALCYAMQQSGYTRAAIGRGKLNPASTSGLCFAARTAANHQIPEYNSLFGRWLCRVQLIVEDLLPISVIRTSTLHLHSKFQYRIIDLTINQQIGMTKLIPFLHRFVPNIITVSIPFLLLEVIRPTICAFKNMFYLTPLCHHDIIRPYSPIIQQRAGWCTTHQPFLLKV